MSFKETRSKKSEESHGTGTKKRNSGDHGGASCAGGRRCGTGCAGSGRGLSAADSGGERTSGAGSSAGKRAGSSRSTSSRTRERGNSTTSARRRADSVESARASGCGDGGATAGNGSDERNGRDGGADDSASSTSCRAGGASSSSRALRGSATSGRASSSGGRSTSALGSSGTGSRVGTSTNGYKKSSSQTQSIFRSRSGRKLTLAESSAEGDDGTGITLRRASLNTAVADTIAEVAVLAQASEVGGLAAERRSETQHVSNASLLRNVLAQRLNYVVIVLIAWREGDREATYTTLGEGAQIGNLSGSEGRADGDGENGGLHCDGRGWMVEQM